MLIAESQPRDQSSAERALQGSRDHGNSCVVAVSSVAELQVPVVLRDGTPVCLRAIRPEDKDRLRNGFEHLSPLSVYQRFLRPVAKLTENDLRYLTELDFHNHVGLALTVEQGGEEQFIAVGRYVRCAPGAGDAELAFTVRDEHQHRGAATLLLRWLIDIGRSVDLQQFTAYILPGNRSMLAVLKKSGLPMRQTLDCGVRCVVLNLKAPGNCR